jgi:nucleotide-binding universal stress UspA family protein
LAPERPNENRPILIAYDGSGQAKAAIAMAGRSLRTSRDAVLVSKKVSEEGAELARKAGFNATPAVIQGSPIWHKIVEAARAEGAGMIVIGSHGRSGVRYAAMGSVATAVAHHATVPVLFARAEEGDPGDRDT